MKVGDVVLMLGSHGEGLEVTAVTGVITGPWQIDGWWEVLTPHHGIIHWPGDQMQRVEVGDDEAW